MARRSLVGLSVTRGGGSGSMSANLQAQRRSPEVPDWSKVGRKPAKAGLPEKFELGGLIWDVLVNAHGSTKEMAYAMTIDRSLLRRKTIDGSLTLEELLRSKPEALVAFGEFLQEHFGERQKSNAQIAREKIPELLAAILAIVEDKK